MKKIVQINSVKELHTYFELPEPHHPHISIVNCSDIGHNPSHDAAQVVLNLYTIALLPDFLGKQFKYGPYFYNFTSGTLCFVGAGHMVTGLEHRSEGISITFHPDLLVHSNLANSISKYDFFNYTVNEGLSLSLEEEEDVKQIIKNIEKECNVPPDSLSQNVITTLLELLMTYSDRFYQRQIGPEAKNSNALIIKFESYIEKFMNDEYLTHSGLPTVQTASEQMFVSPTYLSNVVRSMTGQNAQQFIHSKIIDKAKVLLANSELNISQVAYRLGFDYPQSFNKLFKKKMNMSPKGYRKLFT